MIVGVLGSSAELVITVRSGGFGGGRRSAAVLVLIVLSGGSGGGLPLGGDLTLIENFGAQIG